MNYGRVSKNIYIIKLYFLSYSRSFQVLSYRGGGGDGKKFKDMTTDLVKTSGL